MVDSELPEDTEDTGGPRRKTFSPPAEDAPFTGALPVMGDSDDFGAPVEPLVPAVLMPSPALAPPVRTSLSDEEILSKFSGDAAGNTAELMNELEAQVALREKEEEAFTVWADLTRATRGESAEAIIARERIVFGGGPPEPVDLSEDDDDLGEADDVAAPIPADGGDPPEEDAPEGEAPEHDGAEPDEAPERAAVPVEDDPWPLNHGDDEPQVEAVRSRAAREEPLKDYVPLVDHTGLEPTADNHRVLSTAGLFWSWWATLTPIVGIVAGAFLVSRGLGLVETVVSLGAAGLLSGGLVAASAYAGARTGLSTLHTAQMTFGRHGNVVPSVLIVVIRIALVSLLIVGAETLATRIVTGAGWWPFEVWILRVAMTAAIAGLVLTLALLGGRVLRVALYVTAGVQVPAIIGFVFLTAPALSFAGVTGWSSPGLPVVALGSLALSVLLVLCGHTGGDLARYHRGGGSARGAVGTLTGLVAVIPTLIFVSYVAVVAIGSPRSALTLVTDPVGTLAADMPPWYPAPLLIGLVLPLLGLASLALFSGGLASLSAGLRISRPLATTVFAVISLAAVAAVIAVGQPVAGYVPSLLYVAGVVLAAWGASFALDVVLGAKRLDDVASGALPTWRVAPLAGMTLGVSAGLGMITSSVPWLGWLGYLLPLLEMAGFVDLSSGQSGVLVALVVSGLVSAIAALALRAKTVRVAHG
jgi:NCS1 family nucleobase:cation symporter-1